MTEEQTELETGEEETPPEPKPEEVTAEEQKAEAVKYRRQARAAEKVADELRAELERFRVAQESEQEKAIREAVEAERERLTAEFGTERLHNRLRIRAAGKLNDPEDAVVHLGSELEPDVADEDLDKALESLLEQKEYLASSGTNGPDSGRGLVTQGARSGPPDRSDKTPDDWFRSRARS